MEIAIAKSDYAQVKFEIGCGGNDVSNLKKSVDIKDAAMDRALENPRNAKVKHENGFGENSCMNLARRGDTNAEIEEVATVKFENGCDENSCTHLARHGDTNNTVMDEVVANSNGSPLPLVNTYAANSLNVPGTNEATNFEDEYEENRLKKLPKNSDPKPFKCGECGFAFSRKNHLDRHTLVHTGIRPFQCQTCGGKFSRRSHLKRHAILHNEQNQYTCEECGAAFMLEELLVSHSLIHIARKTSDTFPMPTSMEFSFDVGLPSTEINIEPGKTVATADEPVPLPATSFNAVADFAMNLFNNAQQNDLEQNSCETACPVDEFVSGASNLETQKSPRSSKPATFTPQSAFLKNGGAKVVERRFVCEECGFPFARKKDLHRHSLIHTGCKPFSCDKCGASFSRKYHLNRHANLHHDADSENLTCTNCSVQFSDRKKLDNHVCIQTSDASFNCFESVPELGTQQACSDAPLQDMENSASVEKNESDHTFICLECGEAFSQLGQLQCHAATHVQQLESTPENCNRDPVLAPPGSRNEMEQSSDEDTGPTYSHVPASYRNSTVEERPFKCNVCTTSFFRAKDLRRHAFIHTGRRPFTCDECGVSFKRNHHLQRHVLTHKGHKPYSCQKCGTRFSRSAHLQRHKQRCTHVNSSCSPPSCDEDGVPSTTNENDDALFTVTQGSEQSSFSGTGEKPYPCNECGYPFARKKDLRRHSLIHTGQRPFTCGECGMTFSRNSHLKRHANVHCEKGLFTCEFCGSTFEDEEEMCAHTCENAEKLSITYEKDESSSDCMDLQNGFASLLVETSMTTPDDNPVRVKRELDDELSECDDFMDPAMLGKHGIKSGDDDVGENDSLSEEKLELHHQMLAYRQQNHSPVSDNGISHAHSGDKLCILIDNAANVPHNVEMTGDQLTSDVRPYKCDHCSFSSRYKNDWRRHTLTHAGHKPYSCNQCGATFSRSHHLQRHSLVHSGYRPYQCTECKATFTRSYHLQRHTLVHSGIKLFSCDECDAKFARKEDLRYHTSVHAKRNTKVNTSSTAAEVSTTDQVSPDDLVTDQISHGSAGVSFSRASKARIPTKKIMSPTGEKPYKCDVCGAAFSWKQTLQQHSVVHTGGKPHQCSVCGAQFALRQHLTVHSRTHTASRYGSSKPVTKQGSRPRKDKLFKCEVCDATFAYRLSFSNHTRLHTGEKPFSCEICGEAFGQNRHLNYHRRKCHKEYDT